MSPESNEAVSGDVTSQGGPKQAYDVNESPEGGHSGEPAIRSLSNYYRYATAVLQPALETSRSFARRSSFSLRFGVQLRSRDAMEPLSNQQRQPRTPDEHSKCRGVYVSCPPVIWR